jgi:hypothetical protein
LLGEPYVRDFAAAVEESIRRVSKQKAADQTTDAVPTE